jgi:hypothetical protein
LSLSCEYSLFGVLWCISIQNHFGSANDHTRGRYAQALRRNQNE